MTQYDEDLDTHAWASAPPSWAVGWVSIAILFFPLFRMIYNFIIIA